MRAQQITELSGPASALTLGDVPEPGATHPMTNAEGVVSEAKDVDTALLLGAGWPFWLGGITKYLDQVGISEKMFGRPLSEAGAGAPTT